MLLDYFHFIIDIDLQVMQRLEAQDKKSSSNSGWDRYVHFHTNTIRLSYESISSMDTVAVVGN